MSTISSGTSEHNDNFDDKDSKASEGQTDSNLDAELTGKVERLSQQINGFFNRISGIEKQLSTLSKDIKGLHNADLRSNKGSLDQIHSEIRNLQIHVKKIDKSINDAFGKIKMKKKEKKGKQKGKVKKKK
jgi:archaellum component FlaC